MAQLTVAELTSFVQDFIPEAPQAKIVRKANLVILDLYRRLGQIERSTITTRAKITSATVSATAGSAAVTLSAAVLATSDPYCIIQISGDTTWYTLTILSTTTGTLSSVFAGTTGAALACIVAYPTLVFPANVGTVLKLWRQGGIPIRFAGDQSVTDSSFAVTGPGTPLWWSAFSFDAAATPDDSTRLILSPPPEERESLTFSYKRRPTALLPSGADTQKLLIPDAMNEALQAGVLYWMWDAEDATERSAVWQARYEAALRTANAGLMAGTSTRMQSADEDGATWVWEQRPIT